ncbi:MAG: hypothetical protein PHH59_03845 [Methylovulum sp.]|uniref:hypothetical protein n=1 Tax=Methylovulum sp. TaxID=1916980 RepID=UPI0026297835|nr:hypothetical protein [Methylovulum sp.]MDD2723140.1 hypothetical protein [Methylovulum sp.]MDD5125506.1 hypothetical protein [Methylovulum sp.]
MINQAQDGHDRIVRRCKLRLEDRVSGYSANALNKGLYILAQAISAHQPSGLFAARTTHFANCR